MPDIVDQRSKNQADYNQVSFSGGMNMLLDDTRLQPNQYRLGINLRNRFDRLDPVLSSKQDIAAPPGRIQEMTTFGNYLIVFVDGLAYYKLFTELSWHQIIGFQMDAAAPRYWTESVPVACTNYLRIAATVTVSTAAAVRGGINLLQVSGASAGNLPGLVVQDNINQPQFIFLADDGSGNIVPTVRTTQTFAQWKIRFTTAANTSVATFGGILQDFREYVPIGNLMKFVDGVLYIVSPDGNSIYQSVTGRPLDFVRNVTNLLSTVADADGLYPMVGGGDAASTAYSVGAGPITCIRGMADNSLFVSANGANFRVSKNYANNAPLEFGEYMLMRQFLFFANCLSDRAIIDTIGDTRFIESTGVRSFNAVSQQQNEGRNSPFTAMIQGAFTLAKGNHFINYIVQDPNSVAAIVYDNYELYALNTIFGFAIAVYDTLNQCWVGFDLNQTNGIGIKMFVKIELTAQALFAVTTDDKLYRLYVGPGTDIASFRTVGVSSGILWAGTNVKMANPKIEVKLERTRIILNNILDDCECSLTIYTNNRASKAGKQTKQIKFTEASNPTSDVLALSDVNTQLNNLLFSTPNAEQGWKVFGIIEWTGGSITQFSMELMEFTPMNPPRSQSLSPVGAFA